MPELISLSRKKPSFLNLNAPGLSPYAAQSRRPGLYVRNSYYGEILSYMIVKHSPCTIVSSRSFSAFPSLNRHLQLPRIQTVTPKRTLAVW
jgi:hypothetical protein